LLTLIWLLLWDVTGVTLLYDAAARPFAAIQRVGELLISHDAWHDILTSLAEIGVGLFLGSLLGLTVSTVMRRLEDIQYAIAKILPATYLTPIVLWLLIFHLDWRGSFFLGFGHKMMGVGLLTFFPLVQASWAFRDAPLPRRWLIAIDDALPMAFIAMCFGEFYAATAGIGFEMVIASATYQYQQGFGYFLITVVLLSALSMILRLMVRLSGVQAGQTQSQRS
jgi:ABC-type nitrate/sulfonate/bicarbonate transport system permease component